jgi:serine/threonine protein phosphatase PrpC
VVENMGLLYSGKTDIGLKRKTNQDAIYMSDQLNFFIVADGMGGHNGGDIASSLAVKKAPEYLAKNKDRLEDPCIIKEAFKFANQSIFSEASQSSHLAGMGTTMVSLYFIKSNLHIANVGDSRAYLLNKGSLFQISKDHSLVQEKVNLGIYTRQEAALDRHKNVLVRTIGFEDEVEVDLFDYKVTRNDVLLICSDGLHGKVSDRDIHHLLTTKIPDPAKATQDDLDKLVDALIAQANKNGGQDNISVIIVAAQ